MKTLILSDLELDHNNKMDAGLVFEQLADDLDERYGSLDAMIFVGDLFETFSPETAYDARRMISMIPADEKYLLLGNHDRSTGLNKIAGAFGGIDYEGNPFSPVYIIARPTVMMIKNQYPVAFLPCPDERALYSSSEKTLTKDQLNEAVAKAMNGAMMYLREHAGADPQNALLAAHGTIQGTVFDSGKRSAGLTWQLPMSEIKRWGFAVVGHIHKCVKEDDYLIPGGILQAVHGMIRRHYAHVLHTDDNGKVQAIDHIQLADPRVFLEYAIQENGFENLQGNLVPGSPQELEWDGSKMFFNSIADDINSCIDGLVGLPERQAGIHLKLRFRLPQALMQLIPARDHIREFMDEQIHDDFALDNLKIIRERIASRDVRLDTKGGFDIHEYFRQWAEIQKIDIDHLPEDVQGIIDKELDQIQMSGQQGQFSYRPKTLVAENAFQWPEVNIDFDQWPDTTAITGTNAGGKSNLIEMIVFALFKKSPTATTLDKFINNGSNEATIAHIFESGDETYRIRHGLKRTKSGASCNSTLEISTGDDQWEPIVEHARDIPKKIQKLVCSQDFFLITLISTQRDIGRLVDATPTDWADFIMESRALGQFADKLKKFRDRARGHGQTAEGQQSKVSGLDDIIEQIEDDMNNLGNPEEIKKTIQQMEGAVAEKDELLAKCKSDIKLINKDIATMQTKAQRYDDLNEQYAELVAEYDKNKDITKPDPVPEPKHDRDQLNIDYIDATENIARERKLLRQLESELRDVKDKQDDINRSRDRIKAAVPALKKKIDQLQQAADDAVMPCDSTVDQPPNQRGMETKKNCPAWRTYIDADHLDESKKALDDLMAKLKRLNRIESELDLDTVQRKAGDQRAEIEKLEDQAAGIRKQLDEANKAHQIYQGYQAQLKHYLILIESRDKTKLRMDDIEKEMAALNADLEGVDEAVDQLVAKQKLERKLNDEILELKTNINGHGKDMQLLNKLQIRLANAERDRDEAAMQALNASYLQHAMQILTSAMDRRGGGIPYLIMESSVDEIETVANAILDDAGTDLTVQINTISSIQTGDQRDEIDVRFTDYRGQHDLTAVSGYQESAVVMACRAAMAITGSDFWGMPPELFVQDEGWDRFEIGNYPIAKRLIDAISAQFSRMIYISHIVPIAEYADRVFKVINDDSGVPELKTIK